MIRVVYKDKVELIAELPDDSITYIGKGYTLKEFKTMEEAEAYIKKNKIPYEKNSDSHITAADH